MMVVRENSAKPRPRMKRRHQRATSGERFEPYRKQPRTEEKMSARLSNFQLSDRLEEKNKSNWFFMQKPQMTFEEIEDRLSASSDEEIDAEFEQTATKSKSEPKIEFADEFKNYFHTLKDIADAQKGAHFSPCTDVVLWRPKDEILLPTAWDEEKFKENGEKKRKWRKFL